MSACVRAQLPAGSCVRGCLSQDICAYSVQLKARPPLDSLRLEHGFPSWKRSEGCRRRRDPRSLKRSYDVQDETLLSQSTRQSRRVRSNSHTPGVAPATQRHHRLRLFYQSSTLAISQSPLSISTHSRPPARLFSTSNTRNTTTSAPAPPINDPSLLRPLFLASIGNPGRPYATTRHSAGHVLLQALATHLSTPPLLKSNASDYSGAHYAYAPLAASSDPDPDPDHDILLWRSPSYMNDSGPALVCSFARFKAAAELGRRQLLQHLLHSSSSDSPHNDADPGAQDSEKHSSDNRYSTPKSAGTRAGSKQKGLNKYGLTPELRDTPLLVVLHDELELDLGRFALRQWGVSRSARGHNGLKSIRESLAKSAALDAAAKEDLMLVGVGIGPRPESREPRAVAGFVLEELGRRAEKAVEGLAPAVWTRIGQMREGRRMG